MENKNDVAVVRGLVEQYAELAAGPEMARRRQLWRDHLSLRPTSPPVLATFGMWNVWCREVFADSAMRCQDPFYREWERTLRQEIFHAGIGDDWVLEPWLTLPAVQERTWHNMWGATRDHFQPDVEGGSWKFNPIVKDWADVAKLSAPPHRIDEAATRRDAARLAEAAGDVLPINIDRGAEARSYHADVSYWVTQFRGMEQLMLDMYESPKELHALLAFLRDGALANQQAAEAAGDYSATSHTNQCPSYADETIAPTPNRFGVGRKQLWAFMAAQEFALISPAMHEEFLLQYQLPILKHFGLVAYGCCEDLTRKIGILKQIPNLRIVAVTPWADVRSSAEQLGADYVNSWRPNPTDMISTDFDEAHIRAIIRDGLAACRGGRMHIHLKDVETVQGDTGRLARWVQIVRDEIDHSAW